jgi:ligand-binding sensor domain-containing protein/signal transduction histidine kinase/AraC-like DNA-binding protein
MISRYLLLLCLLVTAAFSKSSGQAMSFQHLTVEDGLSHNAVLAIIQDGRGFLWYGTRYGLSRYDGGRFRIYRNKPGDTTSLPDNQIMSLYLDRHQVLWAGTAAGLARYDPVQDRFERVLLHAGRQTGINCIYEDRKGRRWIGGNNGLYMQDSEGLHAFKPPQIAGYVVRCVYEDKKGQLWIGTNMGLTRMTANGMEIIRRQPGNPSSLSMDFITAITEDRAGRLWIGTQTGGVNIYDPATGHFTHLLQPAIVNNIVRRILPDRSGNMWVGTQEGLSVINPQTLQHSDHQHDPAKEQTLSQNSVHSLFEDNNGSVWIGTYFGGVNMVHAYSTAFTAWQQHPLLNKVSNNVIGTLHEDSSHNLWIATEGGGLDHFNRASGRFSYYKHDPSDTSSIGSNLVKLVYEDKDHHIWAGTHGGGLNLLLPGGRFKRFFYNSADPATFSREITAVLEDAAGRFWVGTNDRLHLLHRRDRELVKEKDSALTGMAGKLSIRYLLQDSRHRVLIGTISGLFVLEGDVMRQVLPGYVNSMYEDHRHQIWVGLYYGGLARLGPDLRQLALYTEKDGLPNSNVLGLLEDDQGQLWISTDNGLVKFDPGRKTFQTYTTSDGLAGNVFNYNSFLKTSDGAFLFGGYSGITSFYPDKIIANLYAAPLVFTGLRLFNNPVATGGENGLLKADIPYTKALRFRHDQRVFTLEFALLNFVKSNKNRYAYRLEGIDPDWIETGHPAVTYSNLPAGHYIFWAKGANNDGVWSRPAQMEITILPPFWRTWWAYGGYILLLALLLFLITRFFFLRALLRKEEELHQVKLNFFTHVSHEIRTHLTLLLAPVEKVTETLVKDDPLQSPLMQLRASADRLLKLVSELMDFRKAETGHLQLHVRKQDLIGFLENIHASFRQQSLDRHISLLFSYDTDEAPLYFDAGQLEKVFFNLLGNAFKFTPDGGRIRLHVSQQQGACVVTVTDNGRGIAPEHMEKLFTNFFQVPDHGLQHTGYGIGLALSRHITEQHGGSLTADSQAPAGEKEGRTCFTVTLPQGRRHFEGTAHIVNEDPAFVAPLVYSPAVSGGENGGHLQPSAVPMGDRAFTIHIIEDNPGLRDLMRQLFGGEYQVLESSSGAAGWSLATSEIPDLVISDVMMPEMDGLQLCTALKTDERTCHIPVILLTARSSQTDHISGLETGADLYLTKPFSTRVLSLSVRNLLAAREKMRERFSHRLQAAAPLSAADELRSNIDTAFLDKVIALVDEHMGDPDFGVDLLARKVAMSQPVLYKKLKAVTGMSVHDLIKSLRLKKAAELLNTRQYTVYQVAYMVGYNDRKYFSREFRKAFGKTPTEFASAGER